MLTQRYEFTQPHVDTLLEWVTSGEIAIPEIQRPFVWPSTDVRDLLDSLLRGFPIGYLIAWRNPDVKLGAPHHEYGDAPSAPMRSAAGASRARRTPAVRQGCKTPAGAMQRRPNAAVLMVRSAQRGSRSLGKRILIDGQQRVTALMPALLGREVVTRDYRTVRIRIAFHPGERRFEVSNPAIQKSPAWVPEMAASAGQNGGMA